MASSQTKCCREWNEEVALSAWNDEVGSGLSAHLAVCAACAKAFDDEVRAARLARGAATGLSHRAEAAALANEVLAKTTRAKASRRTFGMGMGYAALGTAAAGLAAVFITSRPAPELPVAAERHDIDFSAVNIEVLQDLDLAEHLELLQNLEALEAVNDG